LLETDEKGIFAVGDIALFPDTVLGGVRRLTHWESAILQGRLAGANMTGRKRQRFQYLAHHTSEVFDLKFDFVGDFSQPPGRIQREGDLSKRVFTQLHYQGDRLVGAVLCNRSSAEIEEARNLFLTGG
jgi:3-phenylpropionate/trans-cinnamate dioxygenase ferredoxin reductase subunit